jgi:hypothetical protein
MARIVEVQVTHVEQVDQYKPRRRMPCDDCGKRRLVTKHTGHFVGSGEPIVFYLCNECMTATPPWPVNR